MILVAITNRACYPICKALIDSLGSEARVLLMDPEPEIAEELGRKVSVEITARIVGGHQAMACTTGHLMADVALALGSLEPRAVVAVGDRHEVLAIAGAARMMNIPVVHLQAGERSGSVDDDVRFAISSLSAILLAPHEEAHKELLRRGYQDERIMVTGCPSIDLCEPPFEDISVINKYGHGGEFDSTLPYYLVCQHPDTNLSEDENVQSIDDIATKIQPYLCGGTSPGLRLGVVWMRPSLHDAGGLAMNKRLNQISDGKTWRILRHVPHRLMIALINGSLMMTGNSSSMYREAAYLGVPIWPIGERQSGRADAGNESMSMDINEIERLPRSALWASGGGKEAARVILERYGV